MTGTPQTSPDLPAQAPAAAEQPFESRAGYDILSNSIAYRNICCRLGCVDPCLSFGIMVGVVYEPREGAGQRHLSVERYGRPHLRVKVTPVEAIQAMLRRGLDWGFGPQ